ncbi:hypothetical protein L195_g021571 [Trifolium pratense]|uniref:Uncharacterized protein n=1 Tax=Trifolium pratense TaxID=57577 RepID=A0A2K3N5R4_TRIPR|nr:hypothetical protein L195_g021571 [Trifolium pratense]
MFSRMIPAPLPCELKDSSTNIVHLCAPEVGGAIILATKSRSTWAFSVFLAATTTANATFSIWIYRILGPCNALLMKYNGFCPCSISRMRIALMTSEDTTKYK